MVKKQIDVPTPILILAAITKLSQNGLSFKATRENIREVLAKVYGCDLTERQVDRLLYELLSQKLIFKRSGILQDGRIPLYGVPSHRISHEAFTVIKIDCDRFYAINECNGIEGIVHDPPSVESLFQKGWLPECWDPKLIENLEKAVQTWVWGAGIVSRQLSIL